jgi:protein SCO1/2
LIRKLLTTKALLLIAGLSMLINLKTLAQAPPVVGITEHLDSYLPDNIILTNQDGKQVNLKQVVNKPAVINFVYYRCPGICSPLMNGLAELISVSDMTPGKDYDVLTISFDAREGTDLALKKRSTYMKKIGTKDGRGWQFFTADSINIARATQATGFGFKMMNNEYMHEGALILVSPSGKITRYLKGISFQPFEFKLAVVEAAEGKSAPTLISVLKYCYTYDRKAERYSLDITRISATLIITLGLSLLIFLLVKGRRKKSTVINQ